MDFSQYDIDTTAYDSRDTLPGVAWHSMPKDSGAGFWTVNTGVFSGVPAGFETAKMQFGRDPNAPMIDILKAYKLSCVPIATRERMVITDANGVAHYYPARTPKDLRVAGKYSSHIQVMALLPDFPDTPIVLGLKGFTKSVSWTNDPKSSYHVSTFPAGVWPQIQAYAAEVSRANGVKLPPLCLWLVTLGAAVEGGKPLYIQVGKTGGVYVNPFTLLDIEAVSVEFFAHAQELRKSIGLDWEAEWRSVDGVGESQELQPSDPLPVEDDEIPF